MLPSLHSAADLQADFVETATLALMLILPSLLLLRHYSKSLQTENDEPSDNNVCNKLPQCLVNTACH